jgi:hypothetical protein
MFRTLAEGWNWPPEVVERLTPHQLIKLSGKAGGAGGGGSITIHAIADYAAYRDMWIAWDSEKGKLERAERKFAHYLKTR